MIYGGDHVVPSLDGQMLPFFTNKRLLTERKFTTNISTRGILWRLEALKSVFGRGSAPDPVEGAHNAIQTP